MASWIDYISLMSIHRICLEYWGAVLGGAITAFCQTSLTTLEPPPTEIRGVWITHADSRVLLSRDNIRAAMELLKDHHFNVVFPVVWHKGVTMFPSETMEGVFGTTIDPHFDHRDPLAELIEEAHARHIAVVPWFEYGFCASLNEKGGHILKEKPGWGEQDAAGNLLSQNGYEWMNPFNTEVQSFMIELVMEVVDRYKVDGIQGDARMLALPIEGGYSPVTRALYAKEHAGARPPNNCRDSSWIGWRADRLRKFAINLCMMIRSRKPKMLISWTPLLFPRAPGELLQEWAQWTRNGDADLIIPQILTRDIPSYELALAAPFTDISRPARRQVVVVPGVLLNADSAAMSKADLEQVISGNRRHGYKGEVFFSYEGLTRNGNELARVLKERFYTSPAGLPFQINSW
jgi:uncharacterized lipoprotein YddW (UPF0748 family)